MPKRLAQAAALLFAGALSLWAGFAQAHDGAHGAPVLARAAAHATGNAVAIDLKITGLDPDHALMLNGLTAYGAQPVQLIEPTQIPFARDVYVSSTLQFELGVPEIFTLFMDFGVAGSGGVTVIPERVSENDAAGAQE